MALCSCDKTIPGTIMGLIRLNIPGLVLYGGTILPGYLDGEPQDIVSEGYCLANPGHEYIVFLNKAKPFNLKLSNIDEMLIAEWFQPYTGQTALLGGIGQDSGQLVPPKAWGDGPVVLHTRTE